MTASSRSLVEMRLAMLPDALRATLAVPCPALSAAPGRVLATGGGLSEGPARFLVALLVESGVPAEYVPLSEFCAPALPRPADVLVIFSQGLAPNARFPLLHTRAFQRTLLVTSVRPDEDAPRDDVRRLAAEAQARGVEIVRVPPDDERGLLLRVLGPPIAALAAARLAISPARAAGRDHSNLLDSIPAIYDRALAAEAAPLLVDGELAPIALVAPGRYAEACHALRWKLLEGLLVPDPLIWDVLQVAHGPFQSFYDRRHTLIVLERAAATHEAPLIAKLAEVLVPDRHRLHHLPSSLPGALAYFEHDAHLDAHLRATLRAHPVPLDAWPGQGKDGPLYEIAPAISFE